MTLVAVAGTKVLETIDALKKCYEQMHFEQTVLITPSKMDYKEYNRFVFEDLCQYVSTDFCLLFQNDGYILDGSKWTDEFLKYDYIGAPWPAKTHYTKDGQEIRVGNGGFSLRSQKLLQAPRILGLKLTDMGTGFWHEDGNICNYYRKELEDYGIKFAPVEVAARFSTELTVPETVKSFGGHRYL